MEFIDNLKKLGEKENKLYLILLIYLIVGYTVFRILTLVNLSLIGAIIYFPILGFTSFFWFLSLLNIKIKEYSLSRIILLLIIDCILMILFLIVIVVFIIVSIFSYIFFTSLLLLYGCFKMSKEIDERLYYKHGSWFWRGLEFWGGIAISLIFLYLAYIGTFEAISVTNATEIINLAYIVVIIVIICITIYGLIHSFGRKFNGWLGTYFILVTIYTVYLVLKVFLGLTGGSGQSSSLITIIGLLFLDLFILVYSISSIIGKQGEILAERFKKFKKDTLILWLIFSKAAWEYAVNFPYGILGIVQTLGITFYTELGNIVIMITNIGVLIIFLILVVIFGYNGIQAYGEEKKRLKTGKIEIWLSKKSGERTDHKRPVSVANVEVDEKLPEVKEVSIDYEENSDNYIKDLD
jgi:hypothetical protein